jgi:hypothetical protein
MTQNEEAEVIIDEPNVDSNSEEIAQKFERPESDHKV